METTKNYNEETIENIKQYCWDVYNEDMPEIIILDDIFVAENLTEEGSVWVAFDDYGLPITEGKKTAQEAAQEADGYLDYISQF